MTAIPDSKTIGRFCPPRTVSNNRVSKDAFKLRNSDGGYLSVNCLEMLGEERKIQISALSALIRTKLKVRKGSVFAQLKVGETKDYIKSQGNCDKELEFKLNNKVREPSYAGIFNLALEDDITFQDLANYANKSEHYPVE